MFLSISLFVYSLNKKKIDYLKLLLAVLILFLVRWQFSVIMLCSALFVFSLKDIPKFIKNIKILSLLAVGFLFINLLTEYLFNFHIFKLDPILNSIYKRQTYTAGGNLNVNFDVTIIKIILNYLFSPINFKSVLFQL